eukprot:6174446-Pleurochrysis_carterae.AAC.1
MATRHPASFVALDWSVREKVDRRQRFQQLAEVPQIAETLPILRPCVLLRGMKFYLIFHRRSSRCSRFGLVFCAVRATSHASRAHAAVGARLCSKVVLVPRPRRSQRRNRPAPTRRRET